MGLNGSGAGMGQPLEQVRALGVAFMLALSPGIAQAEEVVVFAAASLKTALDQIAQQWQAETGHQVRISMPGRTSWRCRSCKGRLPIFSCLRRPDGWMRWRHRAL